MSAPCPPSVSLAWLSAGIPLTPLPDAAPRQRDPSVPHAPVRVPCLDIDDQALAISNALRYFHPQYHPTLTVDFVQELRAYGHIYMYRFRPSHSMKAYPVSMYPARCGQAACIMMMIMNNLDPAVAQYPHELITYGGNGAVFNNWAQFYLVMQYLSRMSDSQTLVMCSGHPQGLYPSHADAARVVITNGLVVPNYSSRQHLEDFSALGVTMYGQMTAGSYCYIGPQGIVHGTTITILNAGRKYLGSGDVRGKVFVTSGLGGMGGAQPKASVIVGAVCVCAEIDTAAVKKRYDQGWIQHVTNDLQSCVQMVRDARAARATMSIAYCGNVVDLWETLAEESELLVELGSDQTSLHNPFNGGYYPVGLSFDESRSLMHRDPHAFQQAVQASLVRHVAAINKLAARGMRFWDYGNGFLLEAGRAGADILAGDGLKKDRFKYPSYVEDIMGDIFSLGFGPFRWVCASGDPTDLATTDGIAASVIDTLRQTAAPVSRLQYDDNYLWITQAGSNNLVVGSQARILYADEEGRASIAVAMNEAVATGKLKGPVIISRDHHDVSGTDSPFRETSDVRDGSRYCADMAVQNVIGDAMRGATWVALHNGGGVGWGEVMNGGFGMVLDGSAAASRRAKDMLFWDVNNGISRRGWAHNANAKHAITLAMERNPDLVVTMANESDDVEIRRVMQSLN